MRCSENVDQYENMLLDKTEPSGADTNHFIQLFWSINVSPRAAHLTHLGTVILESYCFLQQRLHYHLPQRHSDFLN